MEAVDVTCRSPGKKRHRRTRTISTSSISTSDLPKTPFDAYDTLQERRLGKDFSLIKMNTHCINGDVLVVKETEFNTSDDVSIYSPSFLVNLLKDLQGALH